MIIIGTEDLTPEEEAEIEIMEALEEDIQSAIYESPADSTLAMLATTTVLCQMIAALPPDSRDNAKKHAMNNINEGVDVFVGENNPFKFKRELNA
jgi:hypothetical protein